MSSGQILLEIETNDNPNVTERRFPESMLIVDLKSRLEIITGASADTMELAFHDTAGAFIGTGDDNKFIRDYLLPGAEHRLQLRVKDVNIIKCDDLSSVPKYEMPAEDYAKRNDSVMAFKIRNKLGRFSEDALRAEEENVDHIKVGNRCEVSVKNMPPRRGLVKYVGKIGDKPGFFVGVRYDEPYGKNDGTFQGVRYFQCDANYGSFVRPSDLKVGDYPEQEIDFDD